MRMTTGARDAHVSRSPGAFFFSSPFFTTNNYIYKYYESYDNTGTPHLTTSLDPGLFVFLWLQVWLVDESSWVRGGTGDLDAGTGAVVPPLSSSSYLFASEAGAGAGVAINDGGDGGSRYTSYVVFVTIVSKRIKTKKNNGRHTWGLTLVRTRLEPP